MAYENKIKTSLFGRRMGLDKDGWIVGPRGVREAVGTAATSATTATTITNHGVTSVVTTTDDTWRLEDPVAGCMKTLYTASTSTGTHTIGCVAAKIISTASTASTNIIMNALGDSVTLMGVSTALWIVRANVGTTFV